MKKIVLIAPFILLSFSLFGQVENESGVLPENYTNHSRGDASISLSGNTVFNNPFEPVYAGGFKMRMFVSKRISFDTDLLFGKDYVHFGPGVIGLPIWLLSNELGFSSDEEGSFGLFLFSIALMALSAEHIAYHLPINNTTDISPFVSVLRFKQLTVEGINVAPEDNYAHASFVAGLELNRYFKRFVLSPYFEYNVAYDGYLRGFNLGVNFGYYIPARNKSKTN